jgi:hypothetical protein
MNFMKIISVFLLSPVLLQLITCNPQCGCGRQCYEYYNDSIEICQTTSAEAGQFTKTADSLKRIYGAGTSFLADSVTVSSSSNKALNSITGQLESQGYTCICND